MTVKLKIDGMTCGGCANAVSRVLSAAPAVTRVTVDLEAGSATLETSAEVDPAQLVAAVEDAGYDARVEG
ncbi:MAG: heavy-metal-associated domain-containing protein [Mesorhizobium sp.]|nr:heavy metal-associated domain-containing protein [Mesorhizobium sp.]MBL8577002.1 heavy-metal-associated domain-containing protein [Mesorhizobium sp.]